MFRFLQKRREMPRKHSVYIEKQKEVDYTEVPPEKQRAIFEHLPPAVQEALDKAMPDSLKPKLLPPLPTDSASYALMTAWIKNSVVG